MFYFFDPQSGAIKASYLELERAPYNSFKVVPIPFDVPIDEENLPLTFPSVLQQKYDGILARNPQFNYVAYDDLTDPGTWDQSIAWRGALGNGIFFLNPVNGLLQTEVIDVSAIGLFDRLAPTWDVYTIEREKVGPQGSRTLTKYVRRDQDLLSVQVSVDGGSTFVSALHLQEVTLPAAGNQIVLRFANPSPTERLYLSGAGVLF